jgi:hypothetical protein
MKLKILVVALVLSASGLFAEQFTGWITDQACAKTGQFAGDMHKKCVESGQPIVFVNEADKKIYVIASPDKVKEAVGEKVTLTGDKKDENTIEPQAIKVLKSGGTENR